jgi:hypothetical protein
MADTGLDENSNNSIYTEEELALLNKSKSMRVQMVDAVFKESGGAPTHGGTIRVVNEVLTSLDKTVNDAAQARLKHQETQNQGEILDTVAAVFKAVASQKSSHRAEDVILEVTTKEVPDDIVPGETEIHPDQLMIEDFIQREE